MLIHVEHLMKGALKDSRFQQLLEKKTLSGRDVARLIIMDNVEVDHQRSPLLTQKERRILKNRLRSPETIAEYNRLVETYRIVAFTIMQAEAEAGKLIAEILRLKIILNDFRLCLMIQPLEFPFDHEVKRSFTRGFSSLFEHGEEKRKNDFFDNIRQRHKALSSGLNDWVAYHHIFRDISEYMMIQLDEDIERTFQIIKTEIEDYNRLLLLFPDIGLPYEFPLQPLTMNQRGVSKKMLQYIEERIAITLGNEWRLEKSTFKEPFWEIGSIVMTHKNREHEPPDIFSKSDFEPVPEIYQKTLSKNILQRNLTDGF